MKNLSINEFLAEVATLREKGWEPFIDEHGGIRVRHSVHTNDGSTMSPDVSPLQAVCLELKNFRCNGGHGGAMGAAVVLNLDEGYKIVEATHSQNRFKKLRKKICKALGL